MLLLTDRVQARWPLVDVVQAAVDGGVRNVLLREKDLPRADRVELAAAIRRIRGRLVVASDVDLAREVGAAGVHLAADDPWPTADDLVVGDQRLAVGRSCHNADDLREARDHDADYVTLSPVFATESKPGYGPALGLDGLASLCADVPDLPVLALGGIGPGRVVPCLAAGAAGVAVMGAVMTADDPAEVVATLLDETAGASS